MCKPPDYEAIEANLWRENAEDVIPRLDKEDSDLLKRLQTYVGRFGYERSKVESKIRTDAMFAATFAKEPRRQGIHEKVASAWLAKELKVDIKVLNKSGPKALYLNRDGRIDYIPANETKSSKSLDFCWELNGKTFYAMHKYTKEGGGNQNSQFNEMLELLRNFQQAKNPDRVLIVIVDGPYYTARKMEELNSLTRVQPPKSFAGHIEQAPAIVRGYA